MLPAALASERAAQPDAGNFADFAPIRVADAGSALTYDERYSGLICRIGDELYERKDIVQADGGMETEKVRTVEDQWGMDFRSQVDKPGVWVSRIQGMDFTDAEQIRSYVEAQGGAFDLLLLPGWSVRQHGHAGYEKGFRRLVYGITDSERVPEKGRLLSCPARDNADIPCVGLYACGKKG